jgi:hypothetical protein
MRGVLSPCGGGAQWATTRSFVHIRNICALTASEGSAINTRRAVRDNIVLGPGDDRVMWNGPGSIRYSTDEI